MSSDATLMGWSVYESKGSVIRPNNKKFVSFKIYHMQQMVNVLFEKKILH